MHARPIVGEPTITPTEHNHTCGEFENTAPHCEHRELQAPLWGRMSEEQQNQKMCERYSSYSTVPVLRHCVKCIKLIQCTHIHTRGYTLHELYFVATVA